MFEVAPTQEYVEVGSEQLAGAESLRDEMRHWFSSHVRERRPTSRTVNAPAEDKAVH